MKINTCDWWWPSGTLLSTQEFPDWMTELLRMLDLSYWGCVAEESTAVSADISPSELTEYVQLGKWLQAWWKSRWLTSLSTLPSEILSLKQKLAASTFQGCHPFDQPMVNWWYTGDLGWVLNSKRDYSHTAYCTITIGTRNPNHQPEPSNHPASPGTYMPYCGKSEEEWFAPQPYQWGMARNAWWCL